MTSLDRSRRHMIAGIVGLAGSGASVGKAVAAVLTPRATEGPFYPTPSMRTPDIDNNLVRIEGRVQEAGGEIFTLRGTIRDCDGLPRAHHRIEIWQCDVDGNYMHSRDRRSASFDPAFQGFGHDITDEYGAYAFRTIKPTMYPGRTPHIHVKIFDRDRELLTTQFYIKDEPNNARDGQYRRLSREQAEAVSMVFVQRESGVEARIDVII